MANALTFTQIADSLGMEQEVLFSVRMSPST